MNWDEFDTKDALAWTARQYPEFGQALKIRRWVCLIGGGILGARASGPPAGETPALLVR
jgi:hypothetical protein